MERKKLVVWSGGLDSTLLLDNLAKESTKENPVETISFLPNFIDSGKMKAEKRARRNYLYYAKRKGYHIKNKTIRVSGNAQPTYTGWAQQLCWLSFILPYIPDDCDVYFGFVQGDGVWRAVNHFYEIFTQFKYVRHAVNVELHFPFDDKKKWEVLRDFRKARIPYDCFWTCEHPKVTVVNSLSTRIEACRKCEPCLTHRAAKQEVRMRTKK